jgi:hypothetical protein
MILSRSRPATDASALPRVHWRDGVIVIHAKRSCLGGSIVDTIGAIGFARRWPRSGARAFFVISARPSDHQSRAPR